MICQNKFDHRWRIIVTPCTENLESVQFGLGDILSQWQIVPLAFFGRQIVPDDKMSHFLPMRQIVPRRQNVPLSPRRQNVPTYALMHRRVMESCWDILSPVKKAIGTICRKWKRPVLGIFRGIFFCQETLQHYCLLKEYKRKTSGAICRHWKRK